MKDQITFSEYSKVEILVGEIVEASVPEGSEKLIQFMVDFGPSAGSGQDSEKRMIFSGIKEWYSPEELVGVKTMWVINIPARKNPFGESQGMLFACDDLEGPFDSAQGKKPYIVRIDDSVPNGSEFH